MFDRNLRQSVLIKFSRTPGSSSCFASLVCAYIWWRSQASLPMRREVHITNVSTRLIETRSGKQGKEGGSSMCATVSSIIRTRGDREDKRDIIATCLNVRVVDLCRQSSSFYYFPSDDFPIIPANKISFLHFSFLLSWKKRSWIYFANINPYSTLLPNSWNSIQRHSSFRLTFYELLSSSMNIITWCMCTCVDV